MKTFNIYKHPTQGIQAVKVGFSWPALFFGILWLLSKKLWSFSGIWVATYFFLTITERATEHFAGSEAKAFLYLILAACYFAVWLVPAFKGNSWREHNLFKRGYEKIESIQSKNPDAAIAQATKNTPQNTGAQEHAEPNNLNHYYEVVAEEIKNKKIEPGLFVRATAEGGGDKEKTRSIYIKLRVNELISKHKTKIKQEENQNKIKINLKNKEKNERTINSIGKYIYGSIFLFLTLGISLNLIGIITQNGIPKTVESFFGLLPLLIWIPLIIFVYKKFRKNATLSEEPTPATHVRCPDCRELIAKESRVCKYCGCKLIPQ